MRRQQQVLEYFPKIWDFILPQTGLLRSTLRPSDLGPGGRSYNGPISCLHWTKTFPTQRVGKLIPNKVPDQCWQVISIDMIRELPDSKGYNATLMVVDRLSKWIHAMPIVTSLDSTGVAQLFLEHVWCHHRLPEEVISNCGPAFVSNFSHDLATLLGVKLTPSTSYHPQTDSQTEHVNQEIEVYL